MKSTEELSLIKPIGVRDSIDWINTFVQQLPSSKQNYSKKLLTDCYLYHGKEWSDLSFVECQSYTEYLVRIHRYKNISNKVLKKKVDILITFLEFLQHQNFGNMETLLWKWKALMNKMQEFKEFNNASKKEKLTSSKKGHSKAVPTKKRQIEEVELPTILSDFLQYLDEEGYHQIRKYKNSVKQFVDFLEMQEVDISIFYSRKKKKLLFEKIRGYEKHLAARISKEEIVGATATSYLRSVQLFVSFLCSKDVISQHYSMPDYLRAKGKRANQFVPKEAIIRIMNMIYEHSNHILRDLSIFLLIVDTGCRPIEVCNLLLSDFKKIERTLPFECGKSNRRVLEISREVADVINDYLEIRDTYSPQTESLFLDYRGFEITSSLINSVFYMPNKAAFGESKYPASAFRNTFITNALEEYDFQRVSKIVGHKEWRSTYYYVHRSTKRLLKNTLDKSPI